jgi:hypothetical protein
VCSPKATNYISEVYLNLTLFTSSQQNLVQANCSFSPPFLGTPQSQDTTQHLFVLPTYSRQEMTLQHCRGGCSSFLSEPAYLFFDIYQVDTEISLTNLIAIT